MHLLLYDHVPVMKHLRTACNAYHTMPITPQALESELNTAVQRAAALRSDYCALLQGEIEALQAKCGKYEARVGELEGQLQSLVSQQQQTQKQSSSAHSPDHQPCTSPDQGCSDASSAATRKEQPPLQHHHPLLLLPPTTAAVPTQTSPVEPPSNSASLHLEQQQPQQQQQHLDPFPVSVQPLGPIAQAAHGGFRTLTPPPNAFFPSLPMVGVAPSHGGMARRSSMPTLATLHSRVQSPLKQEGSLLQQFSRPVEAADRAGDAGCEGVMSSLPAAGSAGTSSALNASTDQHVSRSKSRSGALETGSEELRQAVQATVASMAERSASGSLLQPHQHQPMSSSASPFANQP